MKSARSNTNSALRNFSYFTSLATLFLIFVGALVNSTGSGLSVPDWPLSYGTLFPSMVGGVFYEHSHRMVAGTVGLLILVLAVWLYREEKRRWVKKLGFTALFLVILQGVLGGITVLFFLPHEISICHGILAQTFFLTTIMIAYTQSEERAQREKNNEHDLPSGIIKWSVLLLMLVYLQLIIAAIMRHTKSGLAIPDFPTMGGYYVPPFTAEMLDRINYWRFLENFDPVNMAQVMIHFTHRMMAMMIVIVSLILTQKVFSVPKGSGIRQSVFLIDLFILFQIILGISTVLSWKDPYITSFHVLTGAGILGMSFLLVLRAAPLRLVRFKKLVF